MKKIIALIALACLVSQQVVATVYTDKTYLRVPHLKGHDALAEYVVQHREAYDVDKEAIGANVSARGFYQRSTESARTGAYFGARGSNSVEIGGDGNDKLVAAAGLLGNADTALAGTLTLDPRRTVWGVNLGWDQALDKLVEGLFVSVNMPIARATHTMRPVVTGEVVDAETGKGILDYFGGGLTRAAGDHSALAALTSAKITTGDHSKTAVAGLDVNLGYHLVNAEEHGVRVRGLLHIPLGNKSTGEYLFEPMVGNNRHWELGLGAEGRARLMHNDGFTMTLLASAEMRYVLNATEKRTLGDWPTSFFDVNWLQYGAIRVAGAAARFPAANVLTRDASVRQGFAFEGALHLNNAWDMVTVGMGYSVRARQSERVRAKEWSDTAYAFEEDNFVTLASDSAETPAQLSHRLGADLTVMPLKGTVDLTLGVDGAYEFATDNAALSHFEVGAKAGISF